jgi:hypothetical protein
MKKKWFSLNGTKIIRTNDSVEDEDKNALVNIQ